MISYAIFCPARQDSMPDTGGGVRDAGKYAIRKSSKLGIESRNAKNAGLTALVLRILEPFRLFII